MKLYILTDLEGVAGVFDWQTYAESTSRYYEESRILLTEEVNAAIEGAMEGGVDDILVWAGHGGGTSIKFEILNPMAKLIGGSGTKYPCGLDSSFDMLFLIGNHSMEGTPNANLNHTFSSKHIQGMKLNGKLIGEIGMIAAMAGWFNVPTVFISGDEAACNEAKKIMPKIITAPVKKGLGLFSAISLHPIKARELIREKAREATNKYKTIKPFKVKPPYTLEVEFRTTEGVTWRLGRKGIEKVNEKTIRVKSNDFIELLNSW